MNQFAIATALLAIVVVAQPSGAETVKSTGSTEAPLTLTIRTYTVNPADEPSSSTLALAWLLLHEVGIDSRWALCGVSHPDALCAHPLTSSELAMHLVQRSPNTADSGLVPMGTSLIDTRRRTGALATLYLDRVDSLAASTGTGTDVILARAIVHEAAHLVLGTTDHGASGLMRALWSRDMLRLEPASDWVFTPDEGRRLRQALAARGTVD